jgi:hypothetical protein
MDFKNLKKNQTKPKVSRALPNVCDFQKESLDFEKENHRLGYGFKNLWKIHSSAYLSYQPASLHRLAESIPWN